MKTALNGSNLGVGFAVPGDAAAGQVFAGPYTLPAGYSLLWNNYWDGTQNVHWFSGVAARLGFDVVNMGWSFELSTAGDPDAPCNFSQIMSLSMAGNLSLPFGTLSVARDPSAQNEVATLGWVGNNTVHSFNNRKGQVTLNAQDVYNALQLCDPLATQPWVTQAIQNAFQNFLWTCPLVTKWNGRTGSVFMTLSDITCVFYQPGQQPVSPTPSLTSNDDSIATTKWVTEFITNELAGSGGIIATQAWVLANTVNSFNGRMGPVTLTAADVFDVGAASLNSPNFSGIPTAPTAAQGQATGQIATTAFVQQAIAHNTAGVSTFNTRSGDVVLENADIVNAGGLANPSPTLTGSPVAPTQPPGTNLPVIATCEFVQAAIQAGTVQSFNTRTGAVVLTLADVTSVGGAPLVSPNFSSVPTAPTAAPGTNTVQLATCAFVNQAVTAAGGVSSFNGRTGVVDLIPNDISAAGGLVNPSVNLTGIPTATNATAGDNSTRIATTAFVTTALTGTVTSFNTRTGAVVLNAADITAAGGAVLASPAFTGAPTAPTAPANTNNTQLATTQFVMSAILADTTGVTSFNTRTGAISLLLADITGAGGAPLASPSFTGVPLGPTATAGTSTTQLATTAFVQAAIAASGVSSFNARTGAVTLIANDVSAAGGALTASPTFTGVPAAPTAVPGTNTTQLATTAYVMAAVAQPGTALPVVNGTAAAGSSLLYSRQDHVHPTDTSRAAATALANYLPLTGGTINGALTVTGLLTTTAGLYAGNASYLWTVANTWAAGGSYWIVATVNQGLPSQANVTTVLSAPSGDATYGTLNYVGISSATTIVGYTGGTTSTLSWPFNWSDRRLKSNIEPTTFDALGALLGLTVYACDLTSPLERFPETQHWDCVLLADEVEDVIPRAFMAAPEGGYQSLNPLPLVYVLIQAVKQLAARVAQLEGA